MVTMMSEIYDALRACGAPEDQAHSAAQAVAAYEARLDRLEVLIRYQQWSIIALFFIFFAFWIVPPIFI